MTGRCRDVFLPDGIRRYHGEAYIGLVGGGIYAEQQLKYDRCYNRIVDNTKILSLMGASQKDLMPLEEGLRMEFANLTAQRLARIGCSQGINSRMDAYLEKLKGHENNT